MVKTKKGDFIEIDFVARIKDGDVFDTTIESEAKKAGLLKENENEKEKDGEQEKKEKRIFEPFRLCIGQDMILHGLDEQLSEKEEGKEYDLELEPKDAFGKRDPKLIKTISLSGFVKRGMMPTPGEFLNINDVVAKIINVSGGRVVVDFNNPLSDKIIMYKFKITRIIKEEREKVESIAKFYFINYEIKEKDNKSGFILVVKDKKSGDLDKKIKETLPKLEISYQS